MSSQFVLEECWNNEQTVFYFPKWSEYKRPFDEAIQHLREGGLISKWIVDEMNRVHTVQRRSSAQKAKNVTLTMTHTEGPFLILIILSSFATVAFLTEILCSYCTSLEGTSNFARLIEIRSLILKCLKVSKDEKKHVSSSKLANYEKFSLKYPTSKHRKRSRGYLPEIIVVSEQ